MQMQSTQGLTLADIPMGFFPDEAVSTTVTTRSVPVPAPFADVPPAKAAVVVKSRALKIARAKTGQTELRLLAEQHGAETHFAIASSTVAPYAVKREVLVKAGKKKTNLDELQALEEFDRRVALAYPPEKLRNGKTIATHLNLI